MEELLAYIKRRKNEIIKMIEIDRAIEADTYENIARLKEIEVIEKLIYKIKEVR